MKDFRNTFVVVLITLATSLTVSGQRKITFTPQWTAQSQFAGYYAAEELGYYDEAGLDVTIVHPSTSNSAINRLKDGTSDFVTMQMQQAMIEIDKGHKVINILQTMQNTSLQIMPRHEAITSLDDLKGKRVGIWKVGFGDYALMADKERNLEIEWIPFVQNINLFISGVIDATLATSYNELLQIKAAGYDISAAIPMADEGYNFPEDGLYVSEVLFRKEPETVKAFTEASRKGWEWVERHPDEALEIVMKQVMENHVATNRAHQKWMLEEVIRLNIDMQTGTATYSLRPEQVKALNDLMIRHKLITRTISPETLTGKRP